MGPAGDMCSDYQFNYLNNIEYGTPAKFYAASYVYAIPGTEADKGSELSIRRDIYKFGPVSTAMEVYPDFYTFDHKSGKVYQSDYVGGRQSGHAVVIDGWGEENGVKYWWVRNSWGKEWGFEGYFKMLRGTNHCKIEENVVSGIPDLMSANLVLDDKINVENIPKDVQNKFLIHSYSNIAGGIDPIYGYSRRILSFLKHSYKIDLKDLEVPIPNYTKFIAGDPRTYAAQAASTTTRVSKPKGNPILITWAVLGFLVGLLLVLHLMRIKLPTKRTFSSSIFNKVK
jgi:hypothetical protein